VSQRQRRAGIADCGLQISNGSSASLGIKHRAESRLLSISGTQSTLAIWLLHHLDQESLERFEKVNQESLDRGDRRLIEYEISR
jgi:hypothetical protein